MTRLARELVILGCLEELDDHIAGRGRPSVPLTLSGRAGYSAGAMAHPGWIELVLLDFSGKVLARHAEPFTSPRPKDFAELVSLRLRELSSSTEIMRLKFLGLGIAIPGNAADASSYWTVEWLEGWRNIRYPDFFEDYLNFPVWVENESTLAGLADFYDHGLMLSCSSAISIFIGHGVGGSIIYRHNVISGEYGNAGDIGRLFPAMNEPRPSGIDLVRDLNAAGANLQSLFDVSKYVDSHADIIANWTARASKQLLTLVESGAAWIDPGAIVVTGSIPVMILDAIAQEMRQSQWIFGAAPKRTPAIYASRLGSWAMPIGAAMLPIHNVMAIRD
ncbi:ROK family protein [Sphingomonas albertensis]|nr:ROK family protein [Sphingomonas albertensis]